MSGSKLLQKDQAEAQAAQAQQQAQDPVIQMQQMELQLKQQEVQIKQQQVQMDAQNKQAEIQRKMAKDQADIALRQKQQQIEIERIASQERIAGVNAGIKAASQKQSNDQRGDVDKARIKLDAIRTGIDMMKGR